jgi:hypothetical protein
MKIVAEKRAAASHTLVLYAGGSQLTNSEWNGILWANLCAIHENQSGQTACGSCISSYLHPQALWNRSQTPSITQLARWKNAGRDRACKEFAREAASLYKACREAGTRSNQTQRSSAPPDSRGRLSLHKPENKNGQRLNRRWPLYSPSQILFALMLVLWRRA